MELQSHIINSFRPLHRISIFPGYPDGQMIRRNGMAEQNLNSRVLVIDPDGEVRSLVNDLLAGCGCEITGAESHDSDFDTFTCRHPFDVAIIGVTERAGHLLDMIPMLRRMAPKSEIIFLSRSADERMWTEVLARGARDLLVMPPDPKEFSSLLGRILRQEMPVKMTCSAGAA
jgi:DNA-binding NtrC family response regulator